MISNMKSVFEKNSSQQKKLFICQVIQIATAVVCGYGFPFWFQAPVLECKTSNSNGEFQICSEEYACKNPDVFEYRINADLSPKSLSTQFGLVCDKRAEKNSAITTMLTSLLIACLLNLFITVSPKPRRAWLATLTSLFGVASLIIPLFSSNFQLIVYCCAIFFFCQQVAQPNQTALLLESYSDEFYKIAPSIFSLGGGTFGILYPLLAYLTNSNWKFLFFFHGLPNVIAGIVLFTLKNKKQDELPQSQTQPTVHHDVKEEFKQFNETSLAIELSVVEYEQEQSQVSTSDEEDRSPKSPNTVGDEESNNLVHNAKQVKEQAKQQQPQPEKPKEENTQTCNNSNKLFILNFQLVKDLCETKGVLSNYFFMSLIFTGLNITSTTFSLEIDKVGGDVYVNVMIACSLILLGGGTFSGYLTQKLNSFKAFQYTLLANGILLSMFLLMPNASAIQQYSPIVQKLLTLPLFLCIFINETNWALMGISFPQLFPGKLIPFFCSAALFVSRIPGPIIPMMNDFMRETLGIYPFVWIGLINVSMFLIAKIFVKPINSQETQEPVKPQLVKQKSLKSVIKAPFEIIRKVLGIKKSPSTHNIQAFAKV